MIIFFWNGWQLIVLTIKKAIKLSKWNHDFQYICILSLEHIQNVLIFLSKTLTAPLSWRTVLYKVYIGINWLMLSVFIVFGGKITLFKHNEILHSATCWIIKGLDLNCFVHVWLMWPIFVTWYFSKNRPLGRFFLVVAMSVHMWRKSGCVCPLSCDSPRGAKEVPGEQRPRLPSLA